MPDQPAPSAGAALSAEDAKLVTLARSARARTRSAEGAAVRDLDGRTYAAGAVDLPSLRLSAVGGAVAMAVSSAAAGLEAVVVLGDAEEVTEPDLAAVRDLAGPGVPVLRCGPDGTLAEQLTT